MSFTKNIIHTENAPGAVGTYSQGVEYNGIYYFSGQIGIDPTNNEIKFGINEELDQILKNIDALLEAANLDRTNIIKTSIFLTDLKDFDTVNQAYIDYFERPYPARSCVQIAALPKGVCIEIEVIAAK